MLTLLPNAVFDGYDHGVALGREHVVDRGIRPTTMNVFGTTSGWFWARYGWPGVTGFVASLFGIELLVAIRLAWLPPLQPEATSPPLPQ